MRRHLLVTLAATTIVGLLAGPVAAEDANVVLFETTFSPSTVTVQQGSTVTWHWEQGTHKVRDRVAGLGFINSGAPTGPGDSHAEIFASAATYDYVCPLHDGMDGLVRVPMRLARYTEDGFVVRWSTDPAPDGYEFAVQVRTPGAESWWAPWQRGVTRPAAEYVPTSGSGTYKFRSLVRRIGVGGTMWSPALVQGHDAPM